MCYERVRETEKENVRACEGETKFELMIISGESENRTRDRENMTIDV